MKVRWEVMLALVRAYAHKEGAAPGDSSGLRIASSGSPLYFTDYINSRHEPRRLALLIGGVGG